MAADREAANGMVLGVGVRCFEVIPWRGIGEEDRTRGGVGTTVIEGTQ